MGALLQTKESGGRKRRGYRPLAEINMTPLVDVVFVLLIVFMIAAPMLTAGVPVDLPSANARPLVEEDNKPLEVSLESSGKIFVGESEVKEKNFIPFLTAITRNNPDRRIFIRADRNLSYGDVMKLMGAINSAGFRKVALITDPSSNNSTRGEKSP